MSQSRSPRPRPCRGPHCDVTVVQLPSHANPGRFIAVGLPGVKLFVLVREDDPERLADQAAIDAGLAVARQVVCYPSHHAAYKPIPACPDVALFRKSPARSGGSPSSTTRRS